MEEIDFIRLWKEQNEKIEKSLQINKAILKESLQSKTVATLRPLKSIRWIGIIFGVLWCAAIAFIVLVSWNKTNVFFKSSLIIHFFISLIAVALYIYHLALLNKCNVSQSIIVSQQKLIKLEESNLLTLRLLLVQLPVFSTWFITYEWIENSPYSFWGIQMPIVLLQTYIGIWFYNNLNYKNYDKKWFNWFISKGEFASIKKSMQLLNEIEDLKKL